jgi:hypothetical protein
MNSIKHLLSKFKHRVSRRSHRGNALIITISILLLATAQLLFMGLISSSTTTDEGLLAGQNSDVRDALNLSFAELESRINIAINFAITNGWTTPSAAVNAVVPNFQQGWGCMPSYQRDPSNLNTVLASSSATCPFGTTLQARLPIETAVSSSPTATPVVQAPLNRYTDIRVYVTAINGKQITMEARAQGRGMDVVLQKRIILN